MRFQDYFKEDIYPNTDLPINTSSSSKRKLLTILGTLFIFTAIPVTVLVALHSRQLQTPASSAKTAKAPTFDKNQYSSTEILIKVKKEARNKVKSGKVEDTGLTSLNKINKEERVQKFERVARIGKNSKADAEVFAWFKVTLPGKKSFTNGNLASILRKNSHLRPGKDDLEKLAIKLRDDPNVEIAQPNFVTNITAVPNDPYYSSTGSWGQTYPDLWGMKKINAEGAWAIATSSAKVATGSANIVIASIDTGLDRNHPDLKDNIWSNAGESGPTTTEGSVPNCSSQSLPLDKSCNNLDDDGNGYVDDTWGWNFFANNNNSLDDNGHGTHTAGTMAGVGNNGVGVVGVNWTASIMAIKFLSGGGSGDTAGAIGSLTYAADNGAKVLNNSWGGTSTPAVTDAVKYPHDKGAVVVASAGNSSSDTAAFTPSDSPDAISVSATDPDDNLAYFSNYGTKIDVAAPGVNTLSLRGQYTSVCNYGILVPPTDNLTKYCALSGTSMAAPHVSGLAALILSHHPSFTNEDVRQVLRASADDLGAPGFDVRFGRGRINAGKALTINSVLAAHITSPAPLGSIFGLQSVNITGTAAGPNFASYQLSYGKGDFPTSWTTISSSNTPVTNGVLGTWSVSSLPETSYTLRLIATDTANLTYDYYVTVRKVKEQFISQVTTDPTIQTIPVISGTKVAYNTYQGNNPSGRSDIYLTDIASNTTRPVATGSAAKYVSGISGNRVVWEDYRNTNADVYMYDLATNTEKQITSNSGNQFTPKIDGDKIVWSENRNGNGDIYMYDLATNTEKQITTDSNAQSSPDISGNKIVWEDYRNKAPDGGQQSDIYMYDLTTNTERRLTTDPEYQQDPHINGNKVVYQDYRNGNADIYLYDLVTNTEKAISTNISEAETPRISGNFVTWVDYRYKGAGGNGNYGDIYRYDLSTNTELQITTDLEDQWNVNIDQGRIVWEDMRSGNNDIYMYDPTKDTDGDGCPDSKEIGPDWRTGGQRDPNNPWDFFDVPTPVLQTGATTGKRDKVVNLSDVIAILYYVGTSTTTGANANGVSYNTDLNNNGVPDGREYDRSPGTTITGPDGKVIALSGTPNGAVQIADAIAALAQVGTNCN